MGVFSWIYTTDKHTNKKKSYVGPHFSGESAQMFVPGASADLHELFHNAPWSKLLDQIQLSDSLASIVL